jgi:hypothetical protein
MRVDTLIFGRLWGAVEEDDQRVMTLARFDHPGEGDSWRIEGGAGGRLDFDDLTGEQITALHMLLQAATGQDLERVRVHAKLFRTEAERDTWEREAERLRGELEASKQREQATERENRMLRDYARHLGKGVSDDMER